jgi:hypothetical protein
MAGKKALNMARRLVTSSASTKVLKTARRLLSRSTSTKVLKMASTIIEDMIEDEKFSLQREDTMLCCHQV